MGTLAVKRTDTERLNWVSRLCDPRGVLWYSGMRPKARGRYCAYDGVKTYYAKDFRTAIDAAMDNEEKSRGAR